MNQHAPDTVPRLRAADPPGPRRASWLELLTDLAFVVILSQLVERLLNTPSEAAVGSLLLLLVPVWWLWDGLTFYANRFAAVNDLGDFLFAGVQLLGLLMLAAATEYALTNHSTTVIFVLIYAVLRGLLQLQYARAAYYVPVARPYILHVQVGYGIGLVCWVGAALTPAPVNYYLWALGLAVELLTPLVAGGRALHQRFPPDARHLPDRVATFMLLVFGQLAFGTMQGLHEAGLHGAGIGRGLLAGGTLLGVWGAYFNRLYDAPVQALSERQRTGPFWVWLYLHLPLTLFLVLSSVGLTLAVAHRPAQVLTNWLVGGGVGGSYLLTGLLGLVNQWASEQPQPSTRWRVAVRMVAGASLLLAAPWASMVLLLVLATATGLVIILTDYFGPPAPAASFPGIASRYARASATSGPRPD